MGWPRLIRRKHTYPQYVPRTYHVSFPREAHYIYFPVGGFLGRALIWSALLVQFLYHNMCVTLLVLEEGNQTLRRCPKCDMFITWR